MQSIPTQNNHMSITAQNTNEEDFNKALIYFNLAGVYLAMNDFENFYKKSAYSLTYYARAFNTIMNWYNAVLACARADKRDWLNYCYHKIQQDYPNNDMRYIRWGVILTAVSLNNELLSYQEIQVLEGTGNFVYCYWYMLYACTQMNNSLLLQRCINRINDTAMAEDYLRRINYCRPGNNTVVKIQTDSNMNNSAPSVSNNQYIIFPYTVVEQYNQLVAKQVPSSNGYN